MSKMKNYTWEDIQKIYEKSIEEDETKFVGWCDSIIAIEIFSVPKKYRPGLAAAFSVVKWHEKNPERGNGPCGLCILYTTSFCSDDCPLYKKDKDCNDYGSLFDKTSDYSMFNDINKSSDNLYDVLLEIYKEEWEKI